MFFSINSAIVLWKNSLPVGVHVCAILQLMVGRNILTLSILLGLPLSALAASPFAQTSPPGRVYPSPRAFVSPHPTPSKNPRAVLHQAQHAPQLARVLGIVHGMINKLENLSQRLDNQSAAVDKRLEALREAGHTISVDTELDALHAAITKAKDQIATLIDQLNAIPESDHPGQVVPQVREMISSLHTTLEDVRSAFQKLRLAVRDDIRTASPSPVSVTPTP
jgi:hypothetical protein